MNRAPDMPAGAGLGSVLIVVPTLNEAAHVEAVVRSLLDGAPDAVTLAVADGGSTDGTAEIVARLAEADPRIRLVRNPARIQSAGINRAVREVGDGAAVLLRADAHAGYPPGFCRTLLDEMARTGAASVTVPLATVAERGFGAGAAAAQNSLIGTGGSAHRVGRGGRFVDHGHHALMRLDAFRRLGGYDESFTHNEDAEFDRRLIGAGGRIWLTDKAAIRYVPRATAGALFRQYRRYGSGRAAMLLKHRLRPRLRQALPLAVPPVLLLAALGILSAALGAGAGWLWLALPLAFWVAVCLGFGVALAWRAGSADRAWAGPAAMAMHLAWSLGFFGRLLRGRR